MLHLVPPPTGIVVNIGPELKTSRAIVDFAELFLFNVPAITKHTSAMDIYPYWIAFIHAYCAFQFPTNLTDRAIFMREVTFPSTFHAFTLNLFRIGQMTSSFAEQVIQTDPEPSYELIGDVLWDKCETELKWHVTETDMETYFPLPRMFCY